MVIMHERYVGLRAHSGEIAGEIYVRPFFSRFFFCFSVQSDLFFFGGEVCLFGISGLVGARHPGPGAVSFAVEVFNVGGWLTHGDIWSWIWRLIFWLL